MKRARGHDRFLSLPKCPYVQPYFVLHLNNVVEVVLGTGYSSRCDSQEIPASMRMSRNARRDVKASDQRGAMGNVVVSLRNG